MNVLLLMFLALPSAVCRWLRVYCVRALKRSVRVDLVPMTTFQREWDLGLAEQLSDFSDGCTSQNGTIHYSQWCLVVRIYKLAYVVHLSDFSRPIEALIRFSKVVLNQRNLIRPSKRSGTLHKQQSASFARTHQVATDERQQRKAPNYQYLQALGAIV
jgi:hypothetical protein